MTTFIAWMLALPRRLTIGLINYLVEMCEEYENYKPVWFMCGTLLSVFSLVLTASLGWVWYLSSIVSAILCFAYAVYSDEMYQYNSEVKT